MAQVEMTAARTMMLMTPAPARISLDMVEATLSLGLTALLSLSPSSLSVDMIYYMITGLS